MNYKIGDKVISTKIHRQNDVGEIIYPLPSYQFVLDTGEVSYKVRWIDISTLESDESWESNKDIKLDTERQRNYKLNQLGI